MGVTKTDSLFVSYGLFEYDGRLRELIKVSKYIGDKFIYITRANSTESRISKNHCTFSNNTIFKYFLFIIYVLIKAFKMKEIDLLFIDNRRSIIPGIFIYLIKKPNNIIYDSRELYLFKEMNNLFGKIGSVFECYFIKKSNIIISANKYRAKIMTEIYNLKKPPLVFKNIRKLEYNNKKITEKFKSKYKKLLLKDKIKIVSTSGCLLERNTVNLVSAMKKLNDDKYDLFLVGNCPKKDKEKINEIVNKNNLKNIYFINKLNNNELKYFIRRCNIGVVSYHKKNLNNKYCASGKIYEYLNENLPVVTTENIPLKIICNKYKIGVSDDEFINGIKQVSKNYRYFKKNVKIFSDKINIEKNNKNLAIEIIKNLN